MASAANMPRRSATLGRFRYETLQQLAKRGKHACSAKLARLESAHREYVDQGVEILELAKSAYSLYLSEDLVGKRDILRGVLSNCTLKDLTPSPTYKQPFNYLVERLQNQFKLTVLDEFTNSCGTEESDLVADQLVGLRG